DINIIIFHSAFSIFHFQAGEQGALYCLKMENGKCRMENVFRPSVSMMADSFCLPTYHCPQTNKVFNSDRYEHTNQPTSPYDQQNHNSPRSRVGLLPRQTRPEGMVASC
ncbi:MAG: hypothetical protein ACREEM_46920, partial [Blastocatellia bacterium]